MFCFYLVDPGPRPSFSSIPLHLWGRVDYDSDGNADRPPPGGWTELTVIRRPHYDARVDIDPLDEAEPLVLVVRSEDEAVARATAAFLQRECGGELRDDPPPGRG